MTGVVVAVRPAVFKKEDVLTPEMLRVVVRRVIDKNHPAAKAATARARTGKMEGTALMALDAGDQAAGSLLRGIELLMKGRFESGRKPVWRRATQCPDAPIASFYPRRLLCRGGEGQGSCVVMGARTRGEAGLACAAARSRRRWLRLGQPADALEPLRLALERQPQDDDVRRNLAIAQSHLGLHEQAYPTIVPYLRRNPKDADALMIALHALYQIHIEGKTIGSAAEDKAKAGEYARAYAAANGPQQALVEKWAEFLVSRFAGGLRLLSVLQTPSNLLLRLHADQAIDFLAVLQHEQRWDTAHPEPVCGAGILVDVEFPTFTSPAISVES